jgi:hypothetical protein
LANPDAEARRVTTLVPLSRRALIVGAAGVLLVVVVTVSILWVTLANSSVDPTRAAAQIEVLRIGLSIGLGGGGLFALYLAWRRQKSTEIGLHQKDRDQAHQERVAAVNEAHQEQVASDTRTDATARRITDLYTKAVEQLGSDKPFVRLGGLYALERLAQDNISQRQTIVNVLCAYLRMPYTPPSDSPTDNTESIGQQESEARAQERHVRLAAQRVIADHLRPGVSADSTGSYWEDVTLDLTGASLIDFDMKGCKLNFATFMSARFTGFTNFSEARFVQDVNFALAEFDGSSIFRDARFEKAAYFGSRFLGNTYFNSANFDGPTYFSYAYFGQSVDFTSVSLAAAEFMMTNFARGVPPELRPWLAGNENGQ